MPLTILPLGINGYMPSYGRETMSILVLDPPRLILLDAGTGVSRLLEGKVRHLLAGCTDLHILLSHYHLDHVVGLFYLAGLWSEWPVHLYAPGRPFLPVDPLAALRQLLEPPLTSDFTPPAIERFFSITEINQSRFSIDGLDVFVRRQGHFGGSLAYRLADELVYATDTKPDPQTAEFARGARFLFHDVYLGDQGQTGDPADLESHSSFHHAIQFATAAGVEGLVPIHFNPHWDAEKIASLQRISASAGKVLWPVEGMPIV